MVLDRKKESNKYFIGALIVDNHPGLPNIRKAWQAGKNVMLLDTMAKNMIEKLKSIVTAFRRGRNSSEVLGVNRLGAVKEKK